MQKINHARHQPSACPIESKAFESFLRNLFPCSSLLIPNGLHKIEIRRIAKFEREELQIAIQGMANLKGRC